MNFVLSRKYWLYGAGISICNNIVDGMGLGGYGVVFRKCDGVSILANQFRGAPIRADGNATNVLIEHNQTIGPQPNSSRV